MASSRYRSRRSVGMMMNRVDQRLQYLNKRQAPRRLQPYSIFTQALARHAVAHENLGDNAVQNNNVADDAISNDNMQVDSITANEIVANTITANEIAANTITADQIQAHTITADEIAAGSITATEIAANTITGDEIVANIKLEAPIVYGGGMRAYDLINPDPATYIGTVPPVPYVALAARLYPSLTVRSQLTLKDTGAVEVFATNSGTPDFTKFTINGTSVATANHNHGTHTHDFTETGVNSTRATTSALVSDERLKTDIKPLDVGLSFIEALEPVKFKFKNGDGGLVSDEYGMVHIPDDGELATRYRPGVRIHYGLIAQQAREASQAVTEDDFAGWLTTNDDVQMLRYEEFIAPLIKAVQELSARVAELEAKLQ